MTELVHVDACTVGQFESRPGGTWVAPGLPDVPALLRPRTKLLVEAELGIIAPEDERKRERELGRPLSTFEISVIERTRTFFPVTPIGPTTPLGQLVPRPSGLLRLLVSPTGGPQQWVHDGRGTLCVTAPGVHVQVMIPDDAAIVSAGETIETESEVVASRPVVRILAVPASSRRPTFWRAEDHGFVAGELEVPLYPGCQEVWVDSVGVGGAAQLNIGQTVQVAPITLEQWTPAEGATSVFLTGVADTMRVVQRGRI